MSRRSRTRAFARGLRGRPVAFAALVAAVALVAAAALLVAVPAHVPIAAASAPAVLASSPTGAVGPDVSPSGPPSAPARAIPRREPILLPVRFAALTPEGVRLERVLVAADGLTDGDHGVPPNRVALARAAATLVLTERPTDAALMTAAPSGVRVLGVTIVDDVAVVDVDRTLARVRGSRVREELLARQLAGTLAEVAGVRAVRLTVEGRDVERLWGHLDWSEGIEPRPDDAVIPPTLSTTAGASA